MDTTSRNQSYLLNSSFHGEVRHKFYHIQRPSFQSLNVNLCFLSDDLMILKVFSSLNASVIQCLATSGYTSGYGFLGHREGQSAAENHLLQHSRLRAWATSSHPVLGNAVGRDLGKSVHLCQQWKKEIHEEIKCWRFLSDLYAHWGNMRILAAAAATLQTTWGACKMGQSGAKQLKLLLLFG